MTDQERIAELESTLNWFATAGHNAYHKSDDADWRKCSKPLCAQSAKVLTGREFWPRQGEAHYPDGNGNIIHIVYKPEVIETYTNGVLTKSEARV